MTFAVSTAQPRNSSFALSFLARVREAEPRFFDVAALMLLAMLPTAFAGWLDPRQFGGEDIWIKPLKFEFAIAAYFGTMAFYAVWSPTAFRRARWYRLFSSAAVASVVAEMIWIGGAAANGTASHFNTSPVGMVIYPAMGAAAVFFTGATAIYAWQLARDRNSPLPPTLRRGMVLGLALVLPLTVVTAGTMAGMSGHWVGGSGPAETMPVIGWALDRGDLRVAHFFSVHAMHFIPAFALVTSRYGGRNGTPAVRGFAAAYVVLVAFTFAQALAGHPLVTLP